jgi:hypothetical protein
MSGVMSRCQLGLCMLVLALLLAVSSAAPAGVTASLAVSGPYATAVFADHPVAFYPLADSGPGTMTDASGNGHGGSYGGPTGRTSDLSFGVAGPLSSKNTPNVGVASASATVGTVAKAGFLPSGNDARTVEAWFKATSYTAVTASYPLLAWGSSGPGNSYGLVVVQNAVIVDHYGGVESFSTSVDLFDGAWHYVALAYNGRDPGSDTAYVDGRQLHAPQRVSSTVLTTTGPSRLLLGDWIDHIVNSPLAGEEADAAIYATALSASRIAAHYAAAGTPAAKRPGGGGSPPPPPGRPQDGRALCETDLALNGVTTTSPTNAWAVGACSYPNSQGGLYQAAIILHWDGKSWTVQPSPNVTKYSKRYKTRYSQLFGVVATSATNAWAVGANLGGLLIERWNGSTWRVQTSPNRLPSGALLAVAATSPSNAWAVAGEPGANQGLIEHWNGQSWKVQRVGASVLDGVAASSATSAFVVGQEIDHWNGRAWTVEQRAKNPIQDVVRAVTAVSPTTAWATTNSGILRWNGRSWTPQHAPGVARLHCFPNEGFRGIVATSATNAWADLQGPCVPKASSVIEHWDGHAWTVQARLSRSVSAGAIAATSPTNAFTANGFSILHWDGKAWKTQVSY